MGDCQNEDLRVQFDRCLKLKFLGSKVTTDAGLLAYRELDEALGLTEMAQDLLRDSRVGSNKQHQLVPLLRQSIYSRLAGYEDVNDAERLSVDPAMCHVVGGRATLPERQAASTSEVGRFEIMLISAQGTSTSVTPNRGCKQRPGLNWAPNVLTPPLPAARRAARLTNSLGFNCYRRRTAPSGSAGVLTESLT